MVQDGQITAEEAEQLIAVLREVDAAGERLAAAGSARAPSASEHEGVRTPEDVGARASEHTGADEAELDAEFDRAFDEEYESQLGEAEAEAEQGAPASQVVHPVQGTEPPPAPEPTTPQPSPRDQQPANQAPGNADHSSNKRMDEATALHTSMKAAHDIGHRAREDAREAVFKAREAAREAARQGRDAAREAMRTARDAAREAARDARNASREAARASKEATRTVAAEVRAATDQPSDSSRPGAKIAPDHVKWLTVEMLAGELDVEVVPSLTSPAAEGGPGHFDINKTDDGYRIQFMPDRGTFIDRIVTSLKSGELKVQVPPDYGLNVMATAGEVRTVGVKYLRGRMRAGELTADLLEGVDFGMTAGEFTATLDLRPGDHMVTLGAGDLNVRLRESANVRVQGRVSIGDVDSRVPGLQRSGSGLGGSVEGTLGAGEANLDLRVTTGDLDVRMRRGDDG